MKTPTVWKSKYTARSYVEPHSEEVCIIATATILGIRSMLLARCLDERGQGHEAFVVADCPQAFINAEVREGEQLYAQPPEGCNPKIPMDGRTCGVGKCVRPCWVSGHLRGAGRNTCLAS